VWSVKCREQSVKCKVWSVECGVESVECIGERVEGVVVNRGGGLLLVAGVGGCCLQGPGPHPPPGAEEQQVGRGVCSIGGEVLFNRGLLFNGGAPLHI